MYCISKSISLVPCLSDSVLRVRLKSDEIENLNFMHICLPPLPPTCQDSNFICITRPYIPSTAHFNARQLISYKGMKHQPHSLVAYLLSGIKMGSAGKGQFTTTYKILYYKSPICSLTLIMLISLGVKFSQIVMNLKILNIHGDQ